MREIKFRAYRYPREFANNQKIEGKMLYAEMESEKNYLAQSHTGLMFYEYKEDISNVMQFTGLKDKNGKESFFDDLVILKGSEKVFRIMQDDFGIPCFVGDGGSLIIDFKDWFSKMRKDDFEIVGNIYENPELITKGENDVNKTGS